MHFTAIISLFFAFAPSALGHGWILEPKCTFKGGVSWNNMYASQMSDNVLGPKNSYDAQGSINYIDQNLPKSQYKSLKDLILKTQKMLDGADPECGYTILDEAQRQTLPPVIKFTPFIHPGPCECWCDNTLVLREKNCMGKWPDGNIPIDVSKCSGANRFSMYWIGVHMAPWQVYNYCVYLKGGSGGNGSTRGTATTPVVAPQPVPGPGTVVAAGAPTGVAPPGTGTITTTPPSAAGAPTGVAPPGTGTITTTPPSAAGAPTGVAPPGTGTITTTPPSPATGGGSKKKCNKRYR